MISKTIRSFLLLLTLAATSSVVADNRNNYPFWLAEFKKEAMSKGISKKILDSAFKGVTPQPRVVTLDRSQPETVQTLQDYINKRVTSLHIELGRKKLRENHQLLQKIESHFGVQARFIVAFWGLETSYGRYTGGHNVIAAITTLAFDKRRGAFFRKQLLDALFILEEGHVTIEQMTGSWAGAMGQTQFMPSTFRAYAIDGDADGKIDIWGSKADAFSSAANYLSKIGWKEDQTWGREVQLPVKFNQSLIKKRVKKTLPEWQALGVRRMNGRNLPQRKLEANIIQPDGPGERAFITYPANYNAILNWNRSHKFAISIGTLADAVAR